MNRSFIFLVKNLISLVFVGLTEETGSEKPSTNSLDNNSSVKLSSNKRSHSHIRKNARPTRARVGSSKRSHASNSFLGQDASNNNSDEEVMEVSTHQQTLTVNPSPFNNLPSPSKRPFLLRPNNLSSQVTEGKNFKIITPNIFKNHPYMSLFL